MFEMTCLACGTKQVIGQATIQEENWDNWIQLDCFLDGHSVLVTCMRCQNEINLEI